MPAGRRRHPSRDLIIPIALGLTAAIASVGLYFWPDSETSYSSSSSSDEGRKRERGPRRHKSRRRFREYDRISEEDTDDLEEDRRRDEERLRLRRRPSASMAGAVISGAMQVERAVEHAAVDAFEKAKELAVEVLPAKKESAAVKELKKEASMEKPQYVPPPAKKKTVAIVVSERKALEGHDSDSDYEETGLPPSLISHLPYPLDLSLTELNILISSPHLSTHPLSHFTESQTSRLTRKDSAQSSYFPTARRGPSALPPNASTYSLATSILPTTYPLEHILPFTDITSIAPLLRSLAPEILYIEEGMTLLSNGAIVSELLDGGWVGCVVIVLVGEDDQFAGLMDSEDEEESQPELRKSKGEGKWWGDNNKGGVRARFGGRLQVVEAWVLVEDWRRRIEERG